MTGYTKSHKVMFQAPLPTKRPPGGNQRRPSPLAFDTCPAGLPAGFATWSVLGSDEVGWALTGPLTTAAVFVADQVVPSPSWASPIPKTNRPGNHPLGQTDHGNLPGHLPQLDARGL